jgi:arylformamidase
VYLSGHSAGAILTATVCVNTDWTASTPVDPASLKGCVPISGSYDMRAERGAPGYVADASLTEQASPIVNVGNKPPPFLLVSGSVEDRYVESSKALAEKLREHGGTADVLVLRGQAHDDTVWSLGDERSELVQAILKMMKPTGRQSSSF